MIERTNAYKVGDKTFGTLQEAQEHELAVVLGEPAGMTSAAIAAMLVRERDRIVDILTTTAKSKPKARAIHGGTKKRTPKATPSPAP